jgi:hypothetical protein
MTVREALDVVTSPGCRWKPDFFQTHAEAQLTSYVGAQR